MTEVQSGPEGVLALATGIAEPDKEGAALRYRGDRLMGFGHRVYRAEVPRACSPRWAERRAGRRARAP